MYAQAISLHSHHADPVRFPSYMSPLARSLVHGLLNRDPRWRLGAKGVKEVIVTLDIFVVGYPAVPGTEFITCHATYLHQTTSHADHHRYARTLFSAT